MRIDESDPADGPAYVDTARRARSAPPNPDAVRMHSGDTGGTDRPPGSSRVGDSALRIELARAYRAGVDAVYRQDAIDPSGVRAGRVEPETASRTIRRIELEDPKSHTAEVGHSLKGNGRLAEAAELRKGDLRQAPEGAAEEARGGSASADVAGLVRGRAIRSEQSSERVAVSPALALAQDYELRQGYTSSPGLKRDPYHADSVAARSRANQELYAPTSRDRAAVLGYTTRIPAQKVHFDSHGQEAFTNGKSYITPDVDGHNVTSGWKMFNRRGVRIGTYDSELNYTKE